MTDKKEEQKQLQLLFAEDRDLTKMEYANLAEKINAGTIPVEYLRKNLFNSTMTKSFEYSKNRQKTLYEDNTIKITVNRSLHLKHRDVLSILFMDNRGIREKPNSNGEYIIKTNLYHIAKEMCYKTPSSSTDLVKGFLKDLRQTELTFYDKKLKKEYGGHRIIGEYKYDEETKEYLVIIPATTAKKHILGYSVQIPKELNKKILQIPNSLSKIKGLISYVISNKALKNGISFDNLCEKLEIEGASNKSKFKKMIVDNIEILKDFNISFKDGILKYTQIEDIIFHSPVYKEKILPLFVDSDEIADEEEEKRLSELKMLKNIFKNGTLIHLKDKQPIESVIEDIVLGDGTGFRFVLENGIKSKEDLPFSKFMEIRSSNYFKPFDNMMTDLF